MMSTAADAVHVAEGEGGVGTDSTKATDPVTIKIWSRRCEVLMHVLGPNPHVGLARARLDLEIVGNEKFTSHSQCTSNALRTAHSNTTGLHPHVSVFKQSISTRLALD